MHVTQVFTARRRARVRLIGGSSRCPSGVKELKALGWQLSTNAPVSRRAERATLTQGNLARRQRCPDRQSELPRRRCGAALPGREEARRGGLTGRHVSREDEDERPPAPARRFAGQGNRLHFEQFGGLQSVEALRKGRCWGCQGRRVRSSPSLVCRLPTFPAPGRPRAPDRKWGCRAGPRGSRRPRGERGPLREGPCR